MSTRTRPVLRRSRARVAYLSLLLLAAPVLLAPPLGAGEGDGADTGAPALEYRTHAEVDACLRDMRERAWGRGLPAEIVVYGKSRQGRSLLALRLGRPAPVVLVHGGLGSRDAAATVACLHLAERLLSDKASTDGLTWLLLPAPNPDALDAFLAGAPPAG